MTLGERLRYLRDRAGYTQKEVADKVEGLTLNRLSRYETDERKPDPETIASLAKFYEADANWLLGINQLPKQKVQGEEFIEALKKGEVLLDGQELSETEINLLLTLFKGLRKK